MRNKGNSIVSVPDDYIVLDLETTGFDSRHDRIIELSALKCYKGSVVDTFSTLVYPEKTIPQNIEQLTGISNDMVKDAPVIQDVLPQFQIFAGNYPIVGYGVNFDINFVYDNVKKYQHVDFNNDYIDVMGIAQKIHGCKQKLTVLAESYGVNTNSAHRALNDCVMQIQSLMASRLNGHLVHMFLRMMISSILLQVKRLRLRISKQNGVM